MELYQEDRELVQARPPIWQGYVLSGWWRRVGAYLIDAFIAGTIAIVLIFLVDFDFSLVVFEWWGSVALGAVAAFAYYPLLMRATNGRTVGKLATGIRVVRTDHKPMSFARAVWREVVVKTLFFSGIPYAGVLVQLLDGLWPLWDPENRAIHDMLAGTRVVRAENI